MKNQKLKFESPPDIGITKKEFDRLKRQSKKRILVKLIRLKP